MISIILIMRGFKLSLADLCGKLSGNSTLPKMAGNAIDGLTDATAHPDDQVSRKSRLLKGPEEFREVRVDRPKAKGK
jgi:hypothetical protein